MQNILEAIQSGNATSEDFASLMSFTEAMVLIPAVQSASAITPIGMLAKTDTGETGGFDAYEDVVGIGTAQLPIDPGRHPFGFALPEDRIHAPDESYRIASLELGLKAARARARA